MNFDFRLLRSLDKWLLLAVILLVGFGLVMISSAATGYTGTAEGAKLFVIKQGIAFLLGLVGLAVVVLFDYEEFGRMWMLIYGLNCFLLMIVLLIGKIGGGAQSWLGAGAVNLQPGEYGKIMLILTLGHFLAKREEIKSFWDLIPVGVHVMPLLILLLLQPDFGTALVFVVITVAMLYMAGYAGWKILAWIGIPVGSFLGWFFAHEKWPIIWMPLKDYQLDRLKVFFNPALDPNGKGYHVLQSKISIGSGGLFGKGLYHGTQNMLGFLPEQHTDFIYAVVCEELGFIGGAVLIALLLFLLFRILHVSASARDRYGALICVGVMAMLGFHVLENVGMTIGVMPVTGIPLPFISYGGSSMITNLIGVALVLNVGMRRHTLQFR
ncbi:MAG TPA: rod shape-determining protein RodA [Symbiobacteriaceae bacterium]|nr:rod shape-determining protein RodA [Symbiobacteriaceae bacterium]